MVNSLPSSTVPYVIPSPTTALEVMSLPTSELILRSLNKSIQWNQLLSLFLLCAPKVELDEISLIDYSHKLVENLFLTNQCISLSLDNVQILNSQSIIKKFYDTALSVHSLIICRLNELSLAPMSTFPTPGSPSSCSSLSSDSSVDNFVIDTINEEDMDTLLREGIYTILEGEEVEEAGFLT